MAERLGSTCTDGGRAEVDSRGLRYCEVRRGVGGIGDGRAVDLKRRKAGGDATEVGCGRRKRDRRKGWKKGRLEGGEADPCRARADATGRRRKRTCAGEEERREKDARLGIERSLRREEPRRETRRRRQVRTAVGIDAVGDGAVAGDGKVLQRH